jgi:hypothetical protein
MNGMDPHVPSSNTVYPSYGLSFFLFFPEGLLFRERRTACVAVSLSLSSKFVVCKKYIDRN